MPTTLPQLSATLQSLFTAEADQRARDCGFVRRARKLTGARFVQTLVFGWLDNPKASLEDLAEVAAELGAELAPQSLDERFTPQAAELLLGLLGSAVDRLVGARPTAVEVLGRFRGVYAQD